MGQLPILEVDGTMICQGKAIGRLIAKEAGMAGKTQLDQARADMIIDGVDDLGAKMLPIFTEKDENKKLTWADVNFFAFIGFMSSFIQGDHLKGYVNLNKLMGNVSSNPGIAKWLKERPFTQF
ncbi:glutathione S-transferase 1-like [Branchiostoma floridae x Branchiostoma belcheri]